MGDTYKSSKEAFVSDMTGSSIHHINMVSSIALASIALHSALRTRLPPALSPSQHPRFAFEFILLVAPLLLSVTLAAHTPGLLALALLVPTGALLLFVPPREPGTPLPSGGVSSRPASPVRDAAPGDAAAQARPGVVVHPLPALTTYRAHMMLMTALAILAVDFPVFPRALAKCETFGVSLMDLGVGSFVFAQGLVSALPLLKDPAHLSAPLVPKLRTAARKVAPLIALGAVRVLLVKGTEYPEHETEYGRHWNFFITLALLPLLQIALHPLIRRAPLAPLAVAVAVAHQLALAYCGLQVYVLDAPRAGVVSANKEGIVSLFGYLAIHLLGLSAGTLVLPPSPSWFRRQQKAHTRPHSSSSASSASASSSSAPYPEKVQANERTKPTPQAGQRENDKTAIELCSYAIVWWAMLGACTVLGVGGGVSRRLANLPYILWVAAFNTTFLLGYLLLDLLFFPSPLSRSVYSPTSGLKVQAQALRPLLTTSTSQDGSGPGMSVWAPRAPALLEAVNKNGLALFLLANVATGLVNLSMETMYVPDGRAMGVLSAYAFALCAAAWAFRARRLW